MFMFSSSGSADVVGRRLHSAPGLGLSKTPTAEMEHSLHEANAVSASQVATSGSIVLGMGWCVRGREDEPNGLSESSSSGTAVSLKLEH